MKTIIKATTPTVHTLGSLTALGMGFEKEPDGSFSASRSFDTKKEAVNFLRRKIKTYMEENNYPKGKISSMLSGITKFNFAYIDSTHVEIFPEARHH